MKRNRISEKGQAIVFLVIGLVVFLGFIGLAVDGGRAYSDRRYAQNAADASALAAAGTIALEMENRFITYGAFNCGGADVIAAETAGVTAAISRAAANEYTITGPTTDWNGVELDCGDRDYGYTERMITVTVRIEDTTETAFAHLLFPSALEIRAEAVAWVRPSQPLAFGNAIVALNPEGCQGHQNGAIFFGNSYTSIDGGGVWTNGCLRADGSPDVDVINGGVSYVGGTFGNMSIFNTTPVQMPYTLPPESYHVALPDCTGHWVNDTYLTNTANHPLEGLYCLNGNLRINAHDLVVGNGVTLYVPNGEVRINGNATVQLTAPAASPDPYPAIPGVVLYMPIDHTHDIQINGNSDSFWQGTILAPSTDIEVMGTGFIDAYRTQVIGWNVKVGGTADLYVTFQEQNLYSRPASLELAR